MPQQDSLALLKDPVTLDLLASKIWARLAYIGLDGEPRVVPIAFHWDGTDVVLGTTPEGPKVKAISKNPMVAISIDEDGFPTRALSIRGRASIDVQPNTTPEYASAVERYLGPEAGKAWVEGLEGTPMARIAIRPTWVGVKSIP